MITKCRNAITLVLLFLMGLSIFSFLNQAHANSNVNQETTQSNSTQVKVENKDVPKDVDRLAKKNFLSHVSLLDQASHTSKSAYTLGEPFKIYKLNKQSDGNFYYPVLNKSGDVKYIVTISPNPSNKAKYSINVSPFISKALNNYKNQKVTIFTSKKGYFIMGEDKAPHLVLKTPRQDAKSDRNLTKESAVRYSKEFNQTSHIAKPITKYQTAINQQPQYVNTLKNMQIRETQGQNG